MRRIRFLWALRGPLFLAVASAIYVAVLAADMYAAFFMELPPLQLYTGGAWAC
jgi:hypothetical protein